MKIFFSFPFVKMNTINAIDEIKEKLTDGEYLSLMNALQKDRLNEDSESDQEGGEEKSRDDEYMVGGNIEEAIILAQYKSLAENGILGKAPMIGKTTNIGMPIDYLELALHNGHTAFVDENRPHDMKYDETSDIPRRGLDAQADKVYNIENGRLLVYALERNLELLWRYALEKKWKITPHGWENSPILCAARLSKLDFVQSYIAVYGITPPLDREERSYGAMTPSSLAKCADTARYYGHKNVEKEFLSHLSWCDRLAYWWRS